MRATLFDVKGKKKSHVDLPKMFKAKVREDIVAKFFEAEKLVQPYSSFVEAGKRQSASGTISHKRHDWKGHYGRGVSRMPKKTMWRRGTQFMWVGANVPGTRGGRRAHPPKGIGKEKKINKKEILLAFNSAFASTVQEKYIISRYSTLDEFKDPGFVIENLPEKTKELVSALKEIFGKNVNLALKSRDVRAGKGKQRGRKYKSNAGALIVVSQEEDKKFKGFDIRKVSELTISDFYPLGRLTVYTKKAIEELEKPKTKKAKEAKEAKAE